MCLATLAVALLLSLAVPATAQVEYELSLESVAGLGDFDNNVLGTVTPLDASASTVDARYAYSNFSYNSTVSPTKAQIGQSYSLFFVETSEGLALFTIWGTAGANAYATASTTSTGPFASLAFSDEPVGGVTSGGNTRADNITLSGNTIAAVNAETYTGYTDGYAALLTPGDPTPIYFEVDGATAALQNAGMRVYSNNGSGGITSTQVTTTASGTNLNRRLRLRPTQLTVGANVAPANREGWRLLSAPVGGLDVMDLAQMNLVVGVDAGATNPEQFPGFGYINPRGQRAGNLFHAYTGVEVTPDIAGNDSTALIYVPVPDSDYTFKPGEGLWWYWYHPSTTYDVVNSARGGSGLYGTSYNLLDAEFSIAANGSLMKDDVSVSFPLATILPLTYDEDGDSIPDTEVARDYFYMGGNPFAASFDVDGVTATNGTVQAVVYAWDPNKANSSGGFGAHEGILRDGTADTDGFASVWQGFMIEVTPSPEALASNLGPTITYAAASTDASEAPPFYGFTASNTAASAGFAFTLTGTTSGGVESRDTAWLRFLPDAEEGFERYDGSKFADAPARIAFRIERDGAPYRLAMNAIPDGTVTPLGQKLDARLDFAASDAGTYTIAWEGGLADGWKALLLDRETGDRVRMWKQSSYTFSAGETNWSDRFIVRVRPAYGAASAQVASAALSVAETAIGQPYPNPASHTSRIEVILAEAQSVRVTVYDALGREVAVAHDGPLASGATVVALPSESLANGTYVVRVTGDDISETRRLAVVR